MSAPSTLPQRFAAVVGHVVVSIAVTWPLALHLERLPLGRERVATVPQLNLWTLRWTAANVPSGLGRWWDAPIFWPTPGAFAFSEPQPLAGVVFAAMRPLVGDVRGYALIIMLTTVLNGVTAAALARRMGAGTIPAFVAGVLGQALPFAMDQLGVLQLVAVWPMFAATACFLAWVGEPRARHAVLLGLSLAAMVLTCGYYAVLYALCFVVAAPFALRRDWREMWRVRVAGVLLTLGTVMLLTLPVIYGQRSRVGERRWQTETILAGSARWNEWMPGGRLWPGVPLVVLAVLGAWVGRRAHATWVMLATVASGLIISAGYRLAVGGFRPWIVLGDHVSAVAHLRSPFRAAAVVQVALVALAAPALQWLWTRPTTAFRVMVPIAAVASILATGVGAGNLVVPSTPGIWAQELASRDDREPVVFLPFAPGTATADFDLTTTRMLQSLSLGRPMLNGYSGFFPPDHDQVRWAVRGFPDSRSLRLFQDRGIAYVVISDATFDSFDRRVADRLGYRVLAHDGDAWLLAVPPAGGS